MAVAMFIRYPGVSLPIYDRLMETLALDANPPIGEILHVAAEGRDGVDVCDVWQTPEAARAFVEHRLLPAMRDLGVEEELEYRVVPLHNLFAPDIDAIERIGSVSLTAHAAAGALY